MLMHSVTVNLRVLKSFLSGEQVVWKGGGGLCFRGKQIILHRSILSGGGYVGPRVREAGEATRISALSEL